MATKKPVPLRVHQLAKELGINSKDIVSKCTAEGIDVIKDHLSPVSAGLAATVREWFGGAASHSAVETAAPVAVEARPRTAARKRSTGAGAPTAEAGAGAEAGVEAGSEAGPEARPEARPEAVAERSGADTSQESDRAVASAPAIGTSSDANLGVGQVVEPFTGQVSELPGPSADVVVGEPSPFSSSAAGAAEASQAASTAPPTRGSGPSTARASVSPTPAAPAAPAAGAAPGASAASGPTAGSVAPSPASPADLGVAGSAGPASVAAPSTRDQGVPSRSGPAPGTASSAASGAGSGAARTAPVAATSTGSPAAGQTGDGDDAFVQPHRAAVKATAVEHRGDARSAPREASTSAAPARPAAKGDEPGKATRADAGAKPGARPSAERPRAQVTAREAFTPVMNVPTRPDVVKPVGPMLSEPEKVSLTGPRVIRVEAPESLPAPRPRTGPGPGGREGGAGARTGTGAGGRAPTPTARRNDRRREGPTTGRSGKAFAPNETPYEPWRAQDLLERDQRLERASGFIRSHRRDVQRPGGGGPRPSGPSRPEGPVRVAEPITVKELSEATGVKAADILKRLFLSGTMATINSAIDSEKAMDVMLDFGIELEIVQRQSMEAQIASRFEGRESVDVRPRAPVVTILGHVDHGKTSLLDRIRNTNVAAGEAGGITQRTSAFVVPVKAGDGTRVVTFIDTPGHEAFTGMRARGAKVTDIVVLVVAADDGVMPQTVESINHARAAGVPIVVALNKIDKPEATEANITRILGQLAEHGLNPVEWGGTTEVIRTSAAKGTGIQDLLDILDYQAELLGLKAGFGGHARGTVLEARTEEGRGAVANIIVQEGTLSKGNFVVIGRAFGRVRDIVNERGQRVDEAPPSTPVAISGLDRLPDAGDKFFVVDSLKAAEEAAEERRHAERMRELASPKVTLDNIFEHLQKGQRKELSLVLKTDVHGSLETLRALVGKLSTDEVSVSIKHSAIGGITEADVVLAETTGAIVIGFNVTTSGKVRQLAEEKNVEIRLYEIIYDITDDLRKAITGMLAPVLKLEVLGHAEVRQVFRISKVGAVAGCYVTDGVIERNAQIRVTRDGIVVEKDRRLEQLKRFKDDAREVRAGQECGMKINGYDDIREGDVIECYKTVSVAREA